jgi:glycogen phosphorylase
MSDNSLTTPEPSGSRDLRTGMKVEDIQQAFLDKLFCALNFEAFNHGDYYRAVEDKMTSENITKVLYPNDEPMQGKILRLQQQFFFVSCSLRDMLRMHSLLGGKPENFHQKFAIQLNDTHPAIAVAELLRLLLDEHLLDWDTAWRVTAGAISYTNHTLLPEALEKWPLPLFGQLLPRHLELIYEVNRRFLDEVRARFPGDDARLRRMSIIDETGERYLRMAHLATVASHRVNGVAELHSDLLKRTVLQDFAQLWPEKFCNVTNGVSPRRFVAMSNPGLAALLNERIGVDCQNAVSALWEDPVAWTRKSILNVARMGKFSSDRSIREYCERVWRITPSPVTQI